MERLEDNQQDDQQIVISDEEIAFILELEEEAWQHVIEQLEEETN